MVIILSMYFFFIIYIIIYYFYYYFLLVNSNEGSGEEWPAICAEVLACRDPLVVTIVVAVPSCGCCSSWDAPYAGSAVPLRPVDDGTQPLSLLALLWPRISPPACLAAVASTLHKPTTNKFTCLIKTGVHVKCIKKYKICKTIFYELLITALNLIDIVVYYVMEIL